MFDYQQIQKYNPQYKAELLLLTNKCSNITQSCYEYAVLIKMKCYM